jgi:hypothetical protein
LEFSLKSSAYKAADTPASTVPATSCRLVEAARADFWSLLSPIGFNRMRQENAGAEKCNERGGQLKHGNLPYAEMRAVTGTHLKALRFRMVSSPWKNGFVAAIPPLSYFWEVCVAAGTHGRDKWPGHMGQGQ